MKTVVAPPKYRRRVFFVISRNGIQLFKNNSMLSPTVVQQCRQCSLREAKAVLASCCYIMFGDKSVLKAEKELIGAIATELGITPVETAKIAGKVRRGKIKLKKPQTDVARQLLFHLTLHTAVADQTIDHRERTAINHLAAQLKIAGSDVERQLQALHISVTAESVVAEHPLAELAGSLQQRWVSKRLEADLFASPKQPDSRRCGELEYAVTMEGTAELNIEMDEVNAAPGTTLSVFVNGQHTCDVEFTGSRIDQVLRQGGGTTIPNVEAGDTAEIKLGSEVLLEGSFEI